MMYYHEFRELAKTNPAATVAVLQAVAADAVKIYTENAITDWGSRSVRLLQEELPACRDYYAAKECFDKFADELYKFTDELENAESILGDGDTDNLLTPADIVLYSDIADTLYIFRKYLKDVQNTLEDAGDAFVKYYEKLSELDSYTLEDTRWFYGRR